MKVKWFVLVVLFLLLAAFASATQRNVKNLAELNAALLAVMPGDEVLMAAGDYGTGATIIKVARGGTAALPIKIRPATVGARVRIRGAVELVAGKAKYVWWMGTEIDMSGHAAAGIKVAGIAFWSEGGRVINNFIHGAHNNAIGMWNHQNYANPNKEVYGNVAMDAHYPLYGQNNFTEDGYFPVQRNFFMDARDRPVRSDSRTPGTTPCPRTP